MQINVRAVAFRDEGIWIAQCLEYDIVATSETMEDLEEAFNKVLVANICVNSDLGRAGLEGIPPAPAMFEEMFNKSTFGLIEEKRSRVVIPEVNVSDLRISEMA